LPQRRRARTGEKYEERRVVKNRMMKGDAGARVIR